MNLNQRFAYQSITEDASAGYPGDGSTDLLVRLAIVLPVEKMESAIIVSRLSGLVVPL